MRKVIVAVCAALLSMSFAGSVLAHPTGLGVAINFAADEPPGVRSDVLGPAGLLGTENWNNLDLATGPDVFLDTDDGGVSDPSAITVSWSSNNTWSSAGRGEENNTAPDGDDRNLMLGYLDNNPNTPTVVTVSGLEEVFDGEYTVYIYFQGGVNRDRHGLYTIEPGGHSFEGRDGEGGVDEAFDGTYVGGLNFGIIENVEGDSFTLTATPAPGSIRGPLSAIEIISGGPPERLVPSRTLTPEFSAEECAPGGRGPLGVSITMPLGDAAEGDAAEIDETIMGVTASQVTSDGDVTDIFPEAIANGFIKTWLLLGPFEQPGGAAPIDLDIDQDYLTDGAGINEFDVEPKEGDTVDTDFGGAAASTGLAMTPDTSLNPGGVPTWGAVVSATDTVNINAEYYGGTVTEIMTYAVTYIDVEDDIEVQFCIGSDDAVQVYLDDESLWINPVARGVGGAEVCQDFFSIPISAGRHRILVKIFQGGGGHGFRLGLQDAFTFEPAAGIRACSDPDANPCVFDPIGAHISATSTRGELVDGFEYSVDLVSGNAGFSGTVAGFRTEGQGSITLACDTRVTNLTCEADAGGEVEIEWEVHEFDDSEFIRVTVNGEQVREFAGGTVSATLAPGDFEQGFNRICVVNDAGEVCCMRLVGGVSAADILAGGDGTFTADSTIVGLDPDTGLLVSDYLNANNANSGDLLAIVDDTEFIDSTFIIGQEDQAVSTGKALFTYDPGDFLALGASTYGYAIRDVTHRIDQGVTDIFAGGTSTWVSAVSIHSAAGVTYDLAALREAHGEITAFSAFAGVDECPSALVNMYVILSDSEEVVDSISVLQVGANGGEPVEMDIDEDAEFLTLAVGAGDASLACDHGVFANAYFKTGGGVGPGVQFVRGDADGSGAINITDGIYVLNFLFLGGPDPSCKDAADADDSNAINITDGIYILNFLFLGGPDPKAPYPDCGPDEDADETVDCAASHDACV